MGLDKGQRWKEDFSMYCFLKAQLKHYYKQQEDFVTC